MYNSYIVNTHRIPFMQQSYNLHAAYHQMLQRVLQKNNLYITKLLRPSGLPFPPTSIAQYMSA